jgi:non-ribosomal peptide synthetase component E (peptide arylation enzyme)
LNITVIRFLGWKLNAPEIEEAICHHPQVSRAYVIGVADHKTDQRVAALIIETESTGDDSSSMQLANLRRWLAIDQGLPFFKLPTMLRVIPHNHPVPTTATGKPAKREIHDVFFGPEEIATAQLSCGISQRKNRTSVTGHGIGKGLKASE